MKKREFFKRKYKSLKPLFALLIALLMVLGSVSIQIEPARAAGVSVKANPVTGKCGSNCNYSFDPSSGVLLIRGFGAINASAFSFRDDIKDVYIDGGITAIGNDCFFGCSNLKIVAIEDGLVTVGESAFSLCSNLQMALLPTSVTTLGKSAFSYCSSLTYIEIPEKITTIQKNTFSMCTSLTLVFMSNVKTIEEEAFFGCTKLRAFLPKSVGSIGANAFYLTTGVVSYSSNINLASNAFKYTDAIVAPKNSSAHTYATQNNIPFAPLTDYKEITLKEGEQKQVSSPTTFGFPSTEKYIIGQYPYIWLNDADLNEGTLAATNANVISIDNNYRIKALRGGYADLFLFSDTKVVAYRIKVISTSKPEILPEKSCSVSLAVGEKRLVPNTYVWTFDNSFLDHFDGKGNLISAKNVGQTHLVGKNPGKTDITYDIRVEFKDVRSSSNAYYYDSVYWAVDKGITGGVKNNKTGLFETFNPQDNCTRAQMITFLWRMAGCPNPKTSSSPFTDIDKNAYYYKAVLWGTEKGIVGGYSDSTFRPHVTCTRQQAVTFLWRYYDKPQPQNAVSKFTDINDTSAYFYYAVLWASEKKVTGGYSDGTFQPNNTCSRSQMVTFLYRCRDI